ncbi:MAG: hypothetical protein EXQ49_09710 [Acidobacteria bacterium]|nr:hypothetical protein [Acidobacteriota bacterium]
MSLVEIVLALSAIGVPALIHVADAKRTRDAASFIAGQFRLARQRAVMTGRYVAVVFDDVAGEVGWRTCLDGDRDGLSRSDIASGTDRCEAAAEAVSLRFPSVRVEYLPGVPGPDGDVNQRHCDLGRRRWPRFPHPAPPLLGLSHYAEPAQRSLPCGWQASPAAPECWSSILAGGPGWNE